MSGFQGGEFVDLATVIKYMPTAEKIQNQEFKKSEELAHKIIDNLGKVINKINSFSDASKKHADRIYKKSTYINDALKKHMTKPEPRPKGLRRY